MEGRLGALLDCYGLRTLLSVTQERLTATPLNTLTTLSRTVGGCPSPIVPSTVLLRVGKHLPRGRMKPKFNSNSSIFADRGDPWVSERQGMTDFGRSENEDPTFDHYFARRAPEHREKESEKRGEGRDSAKMRLVNSRRLLSAKMRPHSVIVPEIREHPIAPTRASARVTRRAYSLYIRFRDGTEKEEDRGTMKAADTSFRRATARKDVLCVELWSYDTGEMLKQYQPKR